MKQKQYITETGKMKPLDCINRNARLHSYS